MEILRDSSTEYVLLWNAGVRAGHVQRDLRRLVWVDASGKAEVAQLPAGPHQEVRISPDGTRAALLGSPGGRGDVWIYEFGRGRFNRLTFTGTNLAPMWSPDGSSVYYSSFSAVASEATLLKKPADGSRDAVVLAKVSSRAYITWVDPTETAVIVDAVSSSSDRGDILRVVLGATPQQETLVASAANEYASAVSAGRQWLAYQSDRDGTTRNLRSRPRRQRRALAGDLPRR